MSRTMKAISDSTLRKLKTGLPRKYRTDAVLRMKRKYKRTVSPQYVSMVLNGSKSDTQVLAMLTDMRDEHRRALDDLTARIKTKN